MYVIRGDTGRDVILEASHKILSDGAEVAPRGFLTLELSPATLIIDNPRDTLPTGIGRVGLQPSIGAMEALQLIGGVSTPQLLQRIAPAFGRFTNEEGGFDGAYGLRAGPSLMSAAVRMKMDHDTRQAVVNIWGEEDALRPESRDYPCTLSLHFLIRDEKLQMHVLMRSNDAWLGLPYDLFQFSQVQCSLANCLGLDVGPYWHTANSLHAYERNWEQLDALQYEPSFDVVDRISLDGIGNLGTDWEDIQWRAQAILKNGIAALDGPVFASPRYTSDPSGNMFATIEVPGNATPSERWYAEQINERVNGYLT